VAGLSVANRDNHTTALATGAKVSLRDRLPYGLLQLQLLLWRWGCAPAMALLCWWWRVEVGAGARYFGLLQLRRHPLGQIQIGRTPTFRSLKIDNPLLQGAPCALVAGKHGRIQIGDDCGFSGTTIIAHNKVELGQRVLCGANVLICDGDHHPLEAAARAAGATGPCAPIHIADDVWLGMNVVVLKGVTIGAGAVIAANAVVSCDIPPNAIAAGVPAKVVGWVNRQDGDDA
jgi:acetyltransferase-like isoleucine patch superfamily enzyme